MIRAAVLGLLTILVISVTGRPDKPSTGYIEIVPELASSIDRSYGAPPAPKKKACYPKHITRTMTKDVQVTQPHYGTVTEEHPTTLYASITETKVSPTTIIQYSTMTAYAEPKIIKHTKILTDTKMVTEQTYMMESKYGYETAHQYFTETTGVYVTKTDTASYPVTDTKTNTAYETKGYYVTQTKVKSEDITMTETNMYYVTMYVTETKTDVVYMTQTEVKNAYVTMTVHETVPEYHTVTKCSTTSMMYGY